MYILDTDLFSLTERTDSHASQRLLFRLSKHRGVKWATTIITFEEQMRGWMAWLAHARNLEQQVERYRNLQTMLRRYRDTEVLDFDESALEMLKNLQQQRIRIGTMDLKIAAIVLANNATLLSKNLKDFSKVPGLQVEDWSV
jgi:tRNA(fMet)-specific endonuclease VapC